MVPAGCPEWRTLDSVLDNEAWSFVHPDNKSRSANSISYDSTALEYADKLLSRYEAHLITRSNRLWYEKGAAANQPLTKLIVSLNKNLRKQMTL
jgi:hypothetical protein